MISEVIYALGLLIFATLIGIYLHSIFPKLYEKSNISALIYGAITLSYIFTFLGLIGLLYKSALILILAVLVLIISIKILTYRSQFKKYFRSQQNFAQPQLLHLGFIFLPLALLHRKILTSFLNPITGYDALAYHIYAPIHALNYSHKLSASELIPNAGHPLGYQSIYGWISFFTSMHVFALLNFCFIVLTLIALYQSLMHEKILVAITVCFTVIGLVIYCGPTVVISPTSDIALMFFSLMAVIQLAKTEIDFLSRQDLFSRGLLLGFLPMIKPFAMVLVLPLSIIYFIKIFRTTGTSYITLYKALTFIIGLFPYFAWSVKNFIQIGNPFYPMLQGVFQGSGYGPEVMTSEEDVRRSFQQLFDFLRDNPFGGSSMGAQHAHLAIFILIFIFSIYSCFHINRNIRYLFISTVWAGIILIFITGPILRYFLFISVSQVYLLAKSIYPSTAHNSYFQTSHIYSVKMRLRQVLLFSLAGFIVILSVLIPPQYDRIPPSNLDRLNALGIDVAERSFQNVISFVHSDLTYKPKCILVFGEGRAAAFWPMNVKVLPSDRRNPFADPAISTPAAAMRNLQSTGCNLFILASDWGFLPNIDQALISDFEQQFVSKLLFRQPGWTVFDLRF